MKKNLTLNIINLLNDGQWHSNFELLQPGIGGHRFGGRLWMLRKMGFTFEKKGDARVDKEGKEYWKLISSPMYEVVNGHIITNTGKIKRLVKQIQREKPKTLWQKFIKLF